MPNEPVEGPAVAELSAENPLLERLLRMYQRHFDIYRDCDLLGTRLAARAEFHSRGEKYVLVKRAKIWAIECNEHVLFFTLERLTPETLEEITSLLEAAEPHLVQPHPEHMYTYLSAVILAGEVDPEAARQLRRYRLRKNYKFSLHGWCQARIATVATGNGFDQAGSRVITNRDGKELRKALATAIKSA